MKLGKPYPLFIISEENIYPEKLRNLTALSDYLIKNSLIIIDKEWKKIRAEHYKKDREFYNLKLKNEINPLNFNMLLTRINRRDMRQRFILRNDFNKEFKAELATLVKLSSFKSKNEEKVEIKKLISQSSINILILSIEEKDRKKILDLEPLFKEPLTEGGLGIISFYDYHGREKSEIKKILRKKFTSENKIKEYADIIYNNSRDYRDDLIELGIIV